MGWRGFTCESKAFMAYGSKACPKWKFWLQYPKSWARWHWYMARDWLARLKQQ